MFFASTLTFFTILIVPIFFVNARLRFFKISCTFFYSAEVKHDHCLLSIFIFAVAYLLLVIGALCASPAALLVCLLVPISIPRLKGGWLQFELSESGRHNILPTLPTLDPSIPEL